MKKLTKIFALTLAVVMLCLSLASCGGKTTAVSKTFSLMKGAYLDGIGWYQTTTYTLELNDDNTYQLYYNMCRFGAEDYDMRGLRTIVYTGTYTSAASADGEASHLDVTLNPTQIVWEQHGKGFGRTPAMKGTFFVNSAAWTEAMSAVYDLENGTKGASEFIAEYGKSLTVTVEDSTVDLDDNTLTNRIVTEPNLGLPIDS